MAYILRKIGFLSKDGILSMSSFVILVCLFLSISFPAEAGMQQITKNLSFLIIIPILYIKLILKKDLKSYGLNISEKKDRKSGIFWAISMLFVSLLIAYFLLNYTEFKKSYGLAAYLVENFWIFMAYELILVNVLLFIQSFFYQGFILFTYFEKLGYWSILVQFFLYLIFILILGNFSWQLAPFIILSLTGSLVAYKSRSFIYSYIMGLLFIIILDSYIIYTIK
jgi:hypothetical protein